MTMTIQNERAASRSLARAVRKDARCLTAAGVAAPVAGACAPHRGGGGSGFHGGFGAATPNARSRRPAAGSDH